MPRATASLRWLPLLALGIIALVPASEAVAGVTSLDLYSETGDSIGQGAEQHFTSADGSFSSEWYAVDNAIVLRFRTPSNSHYWTLSFAAPLGQSLAAGTYTGAGRYPFQAPTEPGLDVSGDSRGCNTSRGDFQVKQVTYGAGGEVLAFWATFGQHCGGSLPALNGEIRYNADETLALVAPASKWVERGNPLVFDVAARDPASGGVALSASGLPADASFADNGNGTGTFRWLPRRYGSVPVTFEGTNGQGDVDRSVTQIAVIPSTFLVLRGLSATGVPTYYHFAPRNGAFSWGTNWAGGLHARLVARALNQDWIMDFAGPDGARLEVGEYPDAQRFPLQQAGHPGMEIGSGCNTITGSFNISQVTYSAAGDFTSFHATFDKYCVETGSRLSGELALNADVGIVLTVPDSKTVQETDSLTFDVSALDVDDRPLVLSARDLPPGAGFVDFGDGTGRFTWTPAQGQKGQYLVVFRAENDQGASATLGTLVTVSRLNRPPVADAGGPYEGIVGQPVSFDGSGSTDPDGDSIWLYWDLGDGSWDFGPTPAHVYAAPGTYIVTLYASDNVFSSWDETTVIVRGPDGPDLTGSWKGVRALCVGPEESRGCSILAAFATVNGGNAKASDSRLRWFLSDDPVLGETDTPLGEAVVETLEAGQLDFQFLGARLPEGISPSGWYVIAVVDATGDVAETRELNNSIPFGPIPVPHWPRFRAWRR